MNHGLDSRKEQRVHESPGWGGEGRKPSWEEAWSGLGVPREEDLENQEKELAFETIERILKS